MASYLEVIILSLTARGNLTRRRAGQEPTERQRDGESQLPADRIMLEPIISDQDRSVLSGLLLTKKKSRKLRPVSHSVNDAERHRFWASSSSVTVPNQKTEVLILPFHFAGLLFCGIFGGFFFEWRGLALLNACLPAFMGLLLLFMPRSPKLLVSKGRSVLRLYRRFWYSIENIRLKLGIFSFNQIFANPE